MIYLSNQYILIRNGIISQTCNLLIPTSGVQEELTSFEVQTCCCTAGRQNLLTRLLPSKHSLVGLLLEEPTHTPPSISITFHHSSVAASGDDILCKFWEIEENPRDSSNYTPEERLVVQHFNENHCRTVTG